MRPARFEITLLSFSKLLDGSIVALLKDFIKDKSVFFFYCQCKNKNEILVNQPQLNLFILSSVF